MKSYLFTQKELEQFILAIQRDTFWKSVYQSDKEVIWTPKRMIEKTELLWSDDE